MRPLCTLRKLMGCYLIWVFFVCFKLFTGITHSALVITIFFVCFCYTDSPADYKSKKIRHHISLGINTDFMKRHRKRVAMDKQPKYFP